MTQHTHHIPNLSSQGVGRAFYIGIALNAGFTLFEYAAGVYSGSLALISDASHNLTDVASLCISLFALKLSSKGRKERTYGYRKASILASLINAVLLLLIVAEILKSVYQRFSEEVYPQISAPWIVTVALVGVGINFLSALLFYARQKEDINIRGAFLHLMLDALVSLGVVVSGVVMYYTNWFMIDAVVSLGIAALVLVSTWGLLKESLSLILDGVPKDLDFAKVSASIEAVDGVHATHHIHLWALSSSENALTAHVVLDKTHPDDWQRIRQDISDRLARLKVTHITLQPEFRKEGTSENCVEQECK